MTAPLTVTIELDTNSLGACIDELSSLLPKLAQARNEFFHRLVRVIETSTQAFAFEVDNGVAYTDKLIVIAKPSQGLAVLMAALRAPDIDFVTVENALRHLEAPADGCVATAIVGGGAPAARPVASASEASG